MFTGSAEHQPWPEESTTRVAIVDRGLRRPPRRSGPGSGQGPDDLGRTHLDLADPGLPVLDLTDLEPEESGLTDLALGEFALTDFALPDLASPDDEWMGQAACKGRTNLFFGIAGERPERRIRRERSARGVCDSCAVMAPCRERARAGRENGFWGGESEEERAAAGYPPRSISRRSVQQASTCRPSTVRAAAS